MAVDAQLVRAIRGPITLITIGALFSLDHFTPYSFAQTWPVLLIVFGLLSLLRRGAVRHSEPPPWGGPPGTPPWGGPPGSPPWGGPPGTPPWAAPPPQSSGSSSPAGGSASGGYRQSPYGAAPPKVSGDASGGPK